MGRSVKRYQNAAQLLPKPLLAELQNYAAGKMLYVPYPVTRRDFNRMRVLDLRMQGYSLSQIAYRTGLCKSSVSKILQKDRLRALTILQIYTTSASEEVTDGSDESASGETPPSRRS